MLLSYTYPDFASKETNLNHSFARAQQQITGMITAAANGQDGISGNHFGL